MKGKEEHEGTCIHATCKRMYGFVEIDCLNSPCKTDEADF